MGDHPDFEVRRFTSPLPLVDDVFYLASPFGPIFASPIPRPSILPCLWPREVAYADRVDQRDGVRLKTFDSGHEQFSLELLQDLDANAQGASGDAAG
jgi:hypothetical protein